jgi:2-amino-5-formylamino-6-ribosylaminopyrimidin-4(3H)-one 5'-monophosphate deformylase
MEPERVGVLAMGSLREKHGAALPPDADLRFAIHVAQEAARRTGSKYIGILCSSHEFPKIDTGEHQPVEVVLEELKTALVSAKRLLDLRGAVLVNTHGGNAPILKRVSEIERNVGLKIAFNNTLVSLEGPHAGTGELSMGAALGMTDSSKLQEHLDFAKYPEVGFVGLVEARRKYGWAEEQAREVIKFGVKISSYLGEKLLGCAIADVINTIREL